MGEDDVNEKEAIEDKLKDHATNFKSECDEDGFTLVVKKRLGKSKNNFNIKRAAEREQQRQM